MTSEHPPTVSAVRGLQNKSSLFERFVFFPSLSCCSSGAEPTLDQNHRFKLSDVTANLPPAIKGLKCNGCALCFQIFLPGPSSSVVSANSSLKNNRSVLELTIFFLTKPRSCCSLQANDELSCVVIFTSLHPSSNVGLDECGGF